MIGRSHMRRRLGISRRSLNGYGFGDIAPDVASKMDEMVAQLRNESTRVGNMIDSTWTLPGTKDSARGALDTANKSIDYLAGDGRDGVSSGSVSLSDWTNLANGAVDLLNKTAKIIGTTSMSHFSSDVLTALPGAAAKVIQWVAETGGSAVGGALKKSGLMWPLVIGATAIGLGYLLIPKLLLSKRSSK